MVNYLIIALGLVCIIEGLPYFCFPGAVKRIAVKMQEMNSGSLRIFGMVLMAAGLILIYYGRGFFD